MIIENRKCDLNHDLASLFIPWLMRSLNSSDSANSIAPRDTQPWPRQRRIITPPHNSKVTECSVVIAAVSEGNNAYISVFQANEEPWITCLRKQTGRRSSASPVKPKYDSMDSISDTNKRTLFNRESRNRMKMNISIWNIQILSTRFQIISLQLFWLHSSCKMNCDEF